MEIKKLIHFTSDQLGEFGYTSRYKYDVHRQQQDDNISIVLELVKLEDEYTKNYQDDQNDIDRYEELLPLGYSFGAYENDELVGVIIVEPQKWNNTVLIWELRVSTEHRRRNIGTALMNQVVEMARANGFRAIRLETQNYNVPAIKFYNQCGFMIEGIDLSFYTNTDVENSEVALFLTKKL